MSASLPRQVRLQEFVDRLQAVPPMSSADEARGMIADILNAVENELTDIPFNPSSWETDGRMYPPQDDNSGDVDGHPEVTSYRSRKHETLIRKNGAFEIRVVKTHEVIIAKAGSDGKGVWS